VNYAATNGRADLVAKNVTQKHLLDLHDSPITNDQKTSSRRANELDGATWLRYSISVWDDIRKTPEEAVLKHPAMFPVELPLRLIKCFTTPEDRVILDPFVGTGSTVIAAEALGKVGIGLDISENYVEKAKSRLGLPRDLFQHENHPSLGERRLLVADANDLPQYVEPESVDMVITSPPYWDILLQERTADNKPTRHYGDSERDLGKIRDYTAFLSALAQVFEKVYAVLKAGKYCCVVVMDLRKKDRFYPFHADLANQLQQIGFILDDIIIWNRGHEYNNLRPLGYPSVFRINKVHEFILIFKKPSKARHSSDK